MLDNKYYKTPTEEQHGSQEHWQLDSWAALHEVTRDVATRWSCLMGCVHRNSPP